MFHEARGYAVAYSFIIGGRGGIWSLLAGEVWIGFMSINKINIMRQGEAPSLFAAGDGSWRSWFSAMVGFVL